MSLLGYLSLLIFFIVVLFLYILSFIENWNLALSKLTGSFVLLFRDFSFDSLCFCSSSTIIWIFLLLFIKIIITIIHLKLCPRNFSGCEECLLESLHISRQHILFRAWVRCTLSFPLIPCFYYYLIPIECKILIILDPMHIISKKFYFIGDFKDVWVPPFNSFILYHSGI